RAAHRVFGHGLAKGDGCGLDVTSALRTNWRLSARRIEFLPDPGQFVAQVALQTQRMHVVAVQLDDMVGRDAGTLVEVVDVLRDNASRLTHPIDARKREMPAARSCSGEVLVHGEAATPSLVTHFLTGQKIVELNRFHSRPNASRGTKIRDAAFGRNARAG